MEDQHLQMTGFWWRASDYAIFEEELPQKLPINVADSFRYITPAPGARLEEYQPYVGAGSIPEGNAIAITPPKLLDLDLDDESSILTWTTTGASARTASW